METLGERLKELRGDRSQRWLAEQLGIPSTTLSNYENNKSELNFAMIDAITRIFNVETDWLLFGRGPMSREKDVIEISFLGEEEKDARIQLLENELAKAKDEAKEAWKEATKAYQLATQNMRPIAEDIQEIKRAISAPTHNKRLDEKEDQIKQVGK